ncbi:unnamed protein product [Urochloa humidicola]
MASARRALLFAAAFLAVSAGIAARPLHPAMPLPLAAVGALAPAAAPRVVVVGELEVPGAGAVLAPATASRVGGEQEALRVVRELAVSSAGAAAMKCSPPAADVAGDDEPRRRRASSVSSVGRALGSAAPVPPSPANSFPASDSHRAPDDLALHPTMAEGDGGARAPPLSPGLIAGIVCAAVAVVVGALAVAICCYCARKRKAAAGEGSPASPRWVSPNDLVLV